MENISKPARMAIRHPKLIQLYSASTPNGMKVAACLEEIVDARFMTDQFNYEAHTVDLKHSESRSDDFRLLNPNGKIPVITDPHGPEGQPITIFESGAILMYLAEKFDVLLPPQHTSLRYETLKWFMWGSTGLSSHVKRFGFYYKYCAHNLPYCRERYRRECARLLRVLDDQLGRHGRHWVVGDCFTIADLAIWPWIYGLYNNYDNAATDAFYGFKEYPYVVEWYNRCLSRPASQRSLDVTRVF